MSEEETMALDLVEIDEVESLKAPTSGRNLFWKNEIFISI